MRRPYVVAVIIGVALLVVIEWLFLHRDQLAGKQDAGVTLDAGAE